IAGEQPPIVIRLPVETCMGHGRCIAETEGNDYAHSIEDHDGHGTCCAVRDLVHVSGGGEASSPPLLRPYRLPPSRLPPLAGDDRDGGRRSRRCGRRAQPDRPRSSRHRGGRSRRRGRRRRGRSQHDRPLSLLLRALSPEAGGPVPAQAEVRPRERLIALAAVLLVQAGLGLVLLNGLRVEVGAPAEAVQRLIQIALPHTPPPVPPPVQPKAKTEARHSSASAPKALPKPIGGSPGPLPSHAMPAPTPIVAMRPSAPASGGGSGTGPALGSGAG